MSVRRATAAVAVAVAVVVFVAGCSGGVADEDGAARAGASSVPQPAGTAAASDPGSSTLPPGPPVSGGDLTYPVRTETIRLVDEVRTTPAAGSLPEEPRRTLETWLWVPEGEGPFPLVVFGHGLAGHPRLFTQLLGTWASHGYVVAAPTFPRTNRDVPEPTAGLADFEHQPGDMAFVLDEVLAMAAADGPLAGVVDPERIGAAGLSLGGGTTYGFAYNGCCRDDRIDAVQVLAGADFPLPGELDLSTGPPLLVVHGTADPAIPYDTAVRIVGSAGVPTWFVTLVDGLHAQPFEDSESPYDRHVEDLTTAFWDVHLAGRPDRQVAFETAASVPGLIGLQAPDR